MSHHGLKFQAATTVVVGSESVGGQRSLVRIGSFDDESWLLNIRILRIIVYRAICLRIFWRVRPEISKLHKKRRAEDADDGEPIRDRLLMDENNVPREKFRRFYMQLSRLYGSLEGTCSHLMHTFISLSFSFSNWGMHNGRKGHISLP